MSTQDKTRPGDSKYGGAVYFLSEPNWFKIGRSINVVERSKEVVPELIKEKSWAILFEDNQDAIMCEKVIHRMFHRSRLPKIRRDGGTELFHPGCYEGVKNFVMNNKNYLNYFDIKEGEVLFPLIKKIEPTPEQIMRRQKNIERNAQKQREKIEQMDSEMGVDQPRKFKR